MDPRPKNVWTCVTCSKSFTTKGSLQHHMIRHDANAKVKCGTCGKISKHPLALSIHIKMNHTNRDRPRCEICQRIFYKPETLRNHIKNIHSTVKRPRFPCELPGCGKTYLNRESVSRHIKTEHSENPVRLPCSLCGKEFKTRYKLGAHISTHTTEKTHSCSTCGRSFTNFSGMKRHEATHLEKSTRRIFKCQLCPQISLSRTSLQTHIQFVHEKRRNYPCTFCDKRFSMLCTMRRHMDARHPENEEKNLSCDKCEFKTHAKFYLARHARTHNRANRRECYFCQKYFVDFSKLVTHCRRHTLE